MRHTPITLAAINGHIYTVGDVELPDFTAATLRRRAKRKSVLWSVVFVAMGLAGFFSGGG